MDGHFYNYCYPIPVVDAPVWVWQYGNCFPIYYYTSYWNPCGVVPSYEPSIGAAGQNQDQPWTHPDFHSTGRNMGKPMAQGNAPQRRPIRQNKANSTARGCVFCLSNGENIQWAKQHCLKNEKGEVTCPILMKHTCPLCGKTGKEAHTMKYCPRNSDTAGEVTLHTSTGRSYRKKY